MASPQYDLLIVAPQEFSKSLMPLEAHKNSTGILTKMLTLEEIYRNYPGRDEAEKVKRSLADYRGNSGIRYAMLVGDCEKFPVRYTKNDRKTKEAFDTSFCPADLYYADLYESDGRFDDWDRNQNGYFGELRGESTTGVLNVDDVDLRPDVAVGRIPASTADEVAIYVSKVIRYELNANQYSWSKEALLIATIDWLKDACKTQDYIANKYFKNSVVHRLYAPGNPCQKTPAPNEQNINSYLNQGVGFVSYVGHGSGDGWSGYSVNSLSQLTNYDKLPIIFAAACGTAEFATSPPYDPYRDCQGKYHRGTNNGEVFNSTPPQPACLQSVNNRESLGENITVQRATGAIGYVGCITGAQPFGIDLDKFFFEALALGHRTLGGMWNYMVQKYYEVHVPPLKIEKPDWTKVAEVHQPWKFYLFGDPSLRVGGIPRARQEDCIAFDYRKAEVKKIGNRWKIVVGNMWLLDFGNSEEEARQSLRIIQHYQMSKQCFVGRPDPSMEYYLVGNNAPVGACVGEDCIGFNPAAITVKRVGGRWKIVEGEHWILDFGNKEDEAKSAFDIIQKYGFNKICFVGRPGPSMSYFRR